MHVISYQVIALALHQMSICWNSVKLLTVVGIFYCKFIFIYSTMIFVNFNLF